MNPLPLIRNLRTGLSYLAPAVAAALFVELVLEAKYQQGWYAAQGCRASPECSLGGFDALEYAVLGMLVAASFMLVRMGRPRWGNGLALVVALFSGMAWLGMTR